MTPLMLAVCFLLISVSNCQWTLDITVFVIDMKHAEIKDGEFCCCDEDNPCTKNLDELGTCTKGECDIILNVEVSPCDEDTSPEPCSVSTDEIKDAEKIDEYGLCFHFTTTTQANDLTIVMEEKGGGGGKNLIDEFTIVLSLSGANDVTFTGKKQLATIALSYQIHCMNLPDCPTSSLSPTSSAYSEESSIGMSPSKEILVIESSICSVTTVHASQEYTTITVTSTYISSCPSARLEELTAPATASTCTDNPDGSTTYQIAINKTCIKTSIEHKTETVTKTVVLTSTPSSFFCKDTSTLLVTALLPSVDDLGQPTSVAGDSSKAELVWMIVAIFAIVLVAMIGAAATIVCSLMYFKKCSSTSKMSLKPSATLACTDATDNPTYSQLIRNDASLKQCGSRPGDGFTEDESSRLYDDPPGDTCYSFCHKENGHHKMEEDNLYTYATTTAEGAGAEKCPGSPMDYETPLPLNRGNNQELGEYSTLKH